MRSVLLVYGIDEVNVHLQRKYCCWNFDTMQSDLKKSQLRIMD